MLVADDFSTIVLAIADPPPALSGGTIHGDGWTLTLNPGWRITPDPAKARSGIVTRAAP
ncbi:MAG TPA: hypothetical protein VLN49_23100 [Gemmatimonadaceae bacterium]|nr:hypothetical protein [Gemmatimonadaceae bacterium]